MSRPKVVQNRFLPGKNFLAITLFGVIFTRHKERIDGLVLNHERIHCRQQLEWLYIPFFILYLAEWLWYLAKYRNSHRAYRAISFEREAYANERDLSYPDRRRPYANYRCPVAPLLGLIVAALSLSSCGMADGRPVRSVYYWNTVFSLDSAKLDFLEKHRIEKIYLRYFDVVATDTGFPKPNATVAIGDSLSKPAQEIVPVVFVLPEALKCDRKRLAQSIFRRVMQMSETHRLGPVREIQIDCDWTTSTRALFFDLMRELKKLTSERGIKLSSTIRLHQLAQSPPDADRGVLMVYNTGDLRDLAKEKPILDPADVAPYIKHLDDFELPLATAYPIYRWELLFRGGKFVDILHEAGELPILSSDTIVERAVAFNDIIASKRAIETRRPDCASEIILFDLNLFNIKRYDSQQIEDLYY